MLRCQSVSQHEGYEVYDVKLFQDLDTIVIICILRQCYKYKSLLHHLSLRECENQKEQGHSFHFDVILFYFIYMRMSHLT